MRLGPIISPSALTPTALLVAAGAQLGEATHTPRPTCTPYPTFTREPHPGTRTRTEATTRVAVSGEFIEMEGERDWFSGTALSYAEKGTSDFREGCYLAAMENLEEAQRHRDEPSSVLEKSKSKTVHSTG